MTYKKMVVMQMKVIKNFNGSEYFLVGQEGEYSLLKSTLFEQFVVARKIYEVEPEVYEWQESFYFNSDIFGACDCFVKKVLPFDD